MLGLPGAVRAKGKQRSIPLLLLSLPLLDPKGRMAKGGDVHACPCQALCSWVSGSTAGSCLESTQHCGDSPART